MNLVGCNRDFKKTSERINKELDSIENVYLEKLNYQTSKKTLAQAEMSVKKFSSGCYIMNDKKNVQIYINKEPFVFKNKDFEKYFKLRQDVELQSNKISELIILISNYKKHFQSDSNDIQEVNGAIDRINKLYFALDSMCNDSRANLLAIKYLAEKYKNY